MTKPPGMPQVLPQQEEVGHTQGITNEVIWTPLIEIQQVYTQDITNEVIWTLLIEIQQVYTQDITNEVIWTPLIET